MCPEYLHRNAPGRHPNEGSKPPQLAPFNVKEQQFYPKDVQPGQCQPHLVLKGQPTRDAPNRYSGSASTTVLTSICRLGIGRDVNHSIYGFGFFYSLFVSVIIKILCFLCQLHLFSCVGLPTQILVLLQTLVICYPNKLLAMRCMDFKFVKKKSTGILVLGIGRHPDGICNRSEKVRAVYSYETPCQGISF